jgi:hypothetical protein
MYICECGEQFDEIGEDAYQHVLGNHLDLVETLFEEFVEEYNNDGDISEEGANELYEEALYEVTDDLLDEIVEE